MKLVLTVVRAGRLRWFGHAWRRERGTVEKGEGGAGPYSETRRMVGETEDKMLMKI